LNILTQKKMTDKVEIRRDDDEPHFFCLLSMGSDDDRAVPDKLSTNFPMGNNKATAPHPNGYDLYPPHRD